MPDCTPEHDYVACETRLHGVALFIARGGQSLHWAMDGGIVMVGQGLGLS
jgi:hypothetical protein